MTNTSDTADESNVEVAVDDAAERVSTMSSLGALPITDLSLIVACGAFIVSAAFSQFEAMSLLAGIVGIVGAAPAAIAARRHRVVWSLVGLGVMWVVFGFAVDAMPALSDRSAVFDWVSTEGRALVVVGLAAAMCGIQRAASFTLLLRLVVAIVASVSLVTSVLFVVGVDAVRGGALLHGFTTSHHVPGFLACAGLLILIVQPTLFANKVVRIVAGIGMFDAAVLSGSRTSIIALLICAAVVVARRWSIRTLVAPVLIGALLVGVALVGSSRLRQTVEIVTTADFYSHAEESFSSGDSIVAIELSESEAEANMLIRFSIWGRTVDQFTSSPIIGIGRYRVNDEVPMSQGVEGLVYLVTDAERRLHTDAQPHNQVLYLLSETGVVGLGLGLLPFGLAWRRTQRYPDGDVGDGGEGRDRDRELSRLAMLFGFLVGLVSAGLLGTGVGLIGMMMIFGGMRAWELRPESSLRPAAAA